MVWKKAKGVAEQWFAEEIRHVAHGSIISAEARNSDVALQERYVEDPLV